jgi:hypothetical protein
MRFEIVLFIISSVIIYYIYTDGVFFKYIFKNIKYIKIGCVIFVTFMIYFLFKKNPQKVKELMENHNEYIRYLGIDKNTQDILSPVLDMTRTQTMKPTQKPNVNKSTKRAVSESLKKFVASEQNWKCNICRNPLPPTFQTDHIIRLEYGGSNNRENLQCLCPNCHSEKTLSENF